MIQTPWRKPGVFGAEGSGSGSGFEIKTTTKDEEKADFLLAAAQRRETEDSRGSGRKVVNRTVPLTTRGEWREEGLDNSEEQSIMQLKRSLGDNRRNRIKERRKHGIQKTVD